MIDQRIFLMGDIDYPAFLTGLRGDRIEQRAFLTGLRGDRIEKRAFFTGLRGELGRSRLENGWRSKSGKNRRNGKGGSRLLQSRPLGVLLLGRPGMRTALLPGALRPGIGPAPVLIEIMFGLVIGSGGRVGPTCAASGTTSDIASRGGLVP